MTLGMLDRYQAERLSEAGLYYYSHNIDTSEAHYPNIVSTRTFADRLQIIGGECWQRKSESLEIVDGVNLRDSETPRQFLWPHRPVAVGECDLIARDRRGQRQHCKPRRNGRIFQRASSTPLPEWAAEFDAKTWAQFFIKYVLSHPAITVVRTGTTNAAHMLDNIGGGIGRLPNEATRKRMAALIDTLPPNPPPGPPKPPPGITLHVAVIDRYVGEYTSATGFTVTIRRDGTTLFVKPGTNPEVPLLARSETRFQDPRGPFFEFQLDAQGKVTGAVLEQQGPQGTQKIPLERK